MGQVIGLAEDEFMSPDGGVYNIGDFEFTIKDEVESGETVLSGTITWPELESYSQSKLPVKIGADASLEIEDMSSAMYFWYWDEVYEVWQNDYIGLGGSPYAWSTINMTELIDIECEKILRQSRRNFFIFLPRS